VATESVGTGAYSGRKVPEDAFYTMEEGLLHEILMAFDDQLLRPLVLMNFGRQAEYELESKPLVPVRQQATEQMAGPQGAAMGGAPINPMAQLLGGQDAQDNAETEAERNAGMDNAQKRLSLNNKPNATLVAMAKAFMRSRKAA
jgi:hypothetical protein